MFTLRTNLSVIVVSVIFITFCNAYGTDKSICTTIITSFATRHLKTIYRTEDGIIRTQLLNATHMVLETRLKSVCCHGYFEDKNASNFTCKPICSEPCIHGNCIAPNTCTCNHGYVLKNTKSNTSICEAHCTNGCGSGTCVAPETCVCNEGYELREYQNNIANFSCQPICTEPCVNSTCIAPNTCQCLPGYKTSTRSSCKPYCENGCPNGRCVSPGTCEYDISERFKAAETNKWPDLLNVQWAKDNFLVKYNNVKKVFMHIWFEIDNDLSNQTNKNII